MATQYPLQSKAFTWPLSAQYLLSRIHYSALYIRASVPVALFPAIVGNDKTIISYYKTSKHLPLDSSIPVQACSPISIRVTEHAFECFNLAKLTLFNLNIHYSNTHPTAAANDATYNNANEKVA